ncbi:MAG: glycosyltransferase family 2 protein [Thermoguttaceae bacterium]|jgi:glycosyltransferase involved in cell wall biosynthesis|nr:glycosyltransferase family 2 protein [Thermoguttaceae bacterium]
MVEYSLVIPVYNEEESLQALYKEIDDVAKSLEAKIELIFVDDGSSDSSWSIIETLAKEDSRVRGIRFRRNFGKAAALDVGFKTATLLIVMTLDADLQDDPREIPDFLRLLDSGLDVVSGWKKQRHDPWHKVLPSRVFNWLVSTLTGVKLHDHNCGMKCYRREIFDEITLYGELHRFIPVLAAARGYKIGEKVVQHRPRKFGKSKYGLNRFIKGFLDLLSVKFVTGYGQRPQHLLGTFGLTSFFIGAITLSWMALHWVLARIPFLALEEYHLSGRPAVIYSVALMLLGAQLLSVGVVAELLVSYQNRKGREYSIKAEIGKPPKSDE